MNYALNLFTGTTWKEFQDNGCTVTGFREKDRNITMAAKIKPGDFFLCYLTGVSRWAGLLKVESEHYLDDQNRIWNEEMFPVRFKVKPEIILRPEFAVPMEKLAGQLSFYTTKTWSGAVRSSLRIYDEEDAKKIVAALEQARDNPISHPVDEKKLARPVNLFEMKKNEGGETKTTLVVIPSDEDEAEDESEHVLSQSAVTHTEIQLRLLELGRQMGLSVWAPRNDRGREWNGRKISDISLLEQIPTQFDKATNAIISNIDVIWFDGNAVVAAFEIEHTTSIYSGLLRMSDLLVMQPNIDIKLYLVAPDERFEKFKKEVPRPTFAASNKPLHQACKFLSYTALIDRLREINNVVQYLKPEFLESIADEYDPEEFDT